MYEFIEEEGLYGVTYKGKIFVKPSYKRLLDAFEHLCALLGPNQVTYKARAEGGLGLINYIGDATS